MAQIQNDTGVADWLPAFEKGLNIVEDLLASHTPIDKFQSLNLGISIGGGRMFHLEWQLTQRATAAFERGSRIWEKLVAARPSSIGFRRDLALSYAVVGHLKFRAAFQNGADRSTLLSEALACYVRAREIEKVLASDQPTNPHNRQTLADMYNNTANVYITQKKYRDAIAACREAEALSQALIRENPGAPYYRLTLAWTYQDLTQSYSGLTNVRSAVDAIRKEIALRETMAADFPSVPAYKANVQQSYSSVVYQVRSVLPQLTILPTSFLLVFDLYAEVKEKQNAALSANPARDEPNSAPGQGSGSSPDFSFPSPTSHLDAEELAVLKSLYDKASETKRLELLKTVADRAEECKRPRKKDVSPG